MLQYNDWSYFEDSIFYLSITDLPSSDTLHRIQDKYHKSNLEELTHKSGNWQGVSDYYSSLLKLQKSHLKINAKKIVANDSTLDLNAVNEAANQFGFEIGSLLETSVEELVAGKFKKMNNLVADNTYLSLLNNFKMRS